MSDASELVGTYTRVQRIGAGPHAEVWQAEGVRGPVALKVALGERGREMLRHEAAILDRLGHSAVVALEARDPDGHWMALELVQGGPVDEWARGRSHREVATLLSRVADGIGYLHAHDVIHGDLKPSNILVDAQDQPRIIDLGLARIDDSPTDGFHGTLGYAAPELLRGGPPSTRTDIYALGALAYQLISGVLPFQAADPSALAVLPQQSLPAPPSAFAPDLPQQLSDLVLRLLARTPSARPADAGLVATALRTCAEGTPGPAILGMHREREALRRLVVLALDEQPALAVIHGAAGSGRGTLIREATEVARREGMQLLRHQPGDGVSAALDSIMREARRRPTVVTMDASTPEVAQLAARLHALRPPGLVLVRAARPIGPLLALGARHISPPPLSEEEVELLLLHLGHDPTRAPELRRLSAGRPGALLILLHRHELPSDISDRERQLLLAASRGPIAVTDLATRMSLGEHDLLDLVEPLLDRGLLSESPDGTTVERAS